MMRNKWLILGLTLLLSVFVLAACGGDGQEEDTSSDQEAADTEETNEENASEETGGEVNLYTGRHYDTDQELYDTFTEETGIEVNVIEGDDDELIARLDREGEASEADLLITADAGRLHRAKSQDLLQSLESDTLNENIPEKFRDPDNNWFGLTKRARVIAYHKERVDEENLQTYMDLTNEEFQDKVLIRSSSNIYNQSLVASMIATDGEDAAKEWAQGIVDNMARDPQGGDRDQAKAVAAGEGDVAVMNTYYLGKMLNSEDEEEVKVAEQLGIIFPNQDSTGTHVNISGIGVTASSQNTENAQKFIEFLSGEEAQKQFAEANYEYPVNPDVEASELLQSWGEFKEQDISLNELGENNDRAIQIMNEVGWK
ncbi:extracellular solute-binding protein [Halobacillus litoralis]|uniref:Extracellular solute-binding protein n=1 Tax=Halobacillus litoralis TaxID=45668 RepID=A0A845DS23_9BACI|nr:MULTISPECIES: Fe(3+) ABC transporter substrate-binding protein [Halobacillus]MYL20300.1 extracellular solute-binding protein [Halobacillus litoralis]MYL29394.1 extracellular solute-binding protein [Halobacillus halophilus]MYL36611.1 extracellular solute-binding protein [Halobacillus litoralis]